MRKIIVHHPGRRGAHLHADFEILENYCPHREGIWRASYGHYRALKSVRCGEDALICEDDVVPVAEWESKANYALLRIRQETPPPEPFLFSLYVTSNVGIPSAEIRPWQLPAGLQDWGAQALFYNWPMVPIAINLIDSFLRCPLRPMRLGWDHPTFEGFDAILYQASRLLRIPVYFWPLFQHDVRLKSKAKCPPHHSPLLPKIEPYEKIE